MNLVWDNILLFLFCWFIISIPAGLLLGRFIKVGKGPWQS
tara:strand:+ start:691 stop:810 length:120 start_codon:yes stop_codon:yes gene_type:complete